MTNQILEPVSQIDTDHENNNRTMNNTINSVDLLFNHSHSMSKSPAALQNLTDLIFQQMRLDQVGELKGNAPTIPVNDLKGPDCSQYSKQEKNIRCSLASLYRLVDLYGWTQSIYNHISVRSTVNPDNYLINPFGLLYHEIQASSLVLIDSQGNIIDPGSSVLGINKAGWNLHSAIHDFRKDVNCIIHVHTPDVVAVSCLKSGLLPISPEAQELLNAYGVKYHNYNGIIVDDKEREKIQKDLGDKDKILLLHNHGVAICAENIPEAWYILNRVTTACQTQMRLLQLGTGKAIIEQLKNSEMKSMVKSTSINGNANQPRPFENLMSTDDTQKGEENLSSGHIDEKIENEIWTVQEQEFEAEMRILDSAGYKTGHVYKKPNLLRRNPINNGMLRYGDTIMSGNNYDTMADASALMSDSMGDDVATASQAGKSQINKIAENVRAHREKSSTRNVRPNEVSTPKDNKITPKNLINQKSLMEFPNSPPEHYPTNRDGLIKKNSEKTVTLPPNNEIKKERFKSPFRSMSMRRYKSPEPVITNNKTSDHPVHLDAATIAENKKKSSSFRSIFKRKD